MVYWTVCTPNYIAMHHLKCALEMTVRRCFLVTHLANHTAKSPYECPDLQIVICGVELSDLLTTSAYIPCAAHVQKHRKCELRACLIGRVPRHSSPALSRMLNPKFGLSCVHCVIQISQLLLSCVHCVIQISQLLLSCVHCIIQISQLLLSCVHCIIQISQLLLSCVHCVIQISQLLLSCVHCVIQISQLLLSCTLRNSNIAMLSCVTA